MDSASDRPLDERRADYSGFGREDQFIVPLLRALIGGAIERHAPAASAAVVDVGCGAQPLRAELRRRGLRYVGIDVVQNAEKTVDFLAPIDEPLAPDVLAAGPFDLLLCTEVLEHVAQWDRAFANFAALLAPGGKAIITCPFVWRLHEEPYDFWRPTLHAIAAHASRAGLTVIERQAAGSIREALGSMLGQVRIAYDGGGPWVWFRRRLLAVGRQALIGLLKGGLFRGNVRIEGHYYLTSFAVLQKPADAAPGTP